MSLLTTCVANWTAVGPLLPMLLSTIPLLLLPAIVSLFFGMGRLTCLFDRVCLAVVVVVRVRVGFILLL